MKIIAYILEIFAWLSIAISPSILGCGLGALCYFSNPGTLSLVFAVLLGLIGIVLGIVWATRISRTRGALRFMTRYPHEKKEN
jgi:hypothetical protein